MYENGKRLNKHAKNEIHRKERKRKFTPLQYSSYESFVESKENSSWFNSEWIQDKIKNGWLPWHRKWWHDVHGFIHKKPMKKEAHGKARAHYRQELAHYDIEEDEIDMQKKFSDPWCWD